MLSKNLVFIATSLDGYIADKDGSIDWLTSLPNPDNLDMGYSSFMERVDALIMGRNTFETVLNFEAWPYDKPVFVLSNSLTEIPQKAEGKIEVISGSLVEIIANLNSRGFYSLYIDGGKTIQSFLKEDLIDEMIITTIPFLLGGGASLFGSLDKRIDYKCVESAVYLDSIVQSRYLRCR